MKIRTGSAPAFDHTDVHRAGWLPIFQQSWWLDALCGADGWKAGTVFENEQGHALVWPVFTKTFGPLRYLTLPPFTQQLDWAFDEKQHYRYTGFFEQDRRAVLFRLALPDTPGNRQLLENRGFVCKKGFTYRISRPATVEQAWQKISATARARIRKSAAVLQVRQDNDPNKLYQLVVKSHRRHGLGIGISANICSRLVQACVEKDRGGIFLAEDDRGRVHAAALAVWDEQRLYYLLAGMDDAIQQTGAARLLIWHTMQLAFSKGLDYDFHGGMSPEVGSVYASMGAEPSFYLRAVRYRPAFLEQIVTTAKRFYAPNDRIFH
jgi:hypothetical protein